MQHVITPTNCRPVSFLGEVIIKAGKPFPLTPKVKTTRWNVITLYRLESLRYESLVSVEQFDLDAGEKPYIEVFYGEVDQTAHWLAEFNPVLPWPRTRAKTLNPNQRRMESELRLQWTELMRTIYDHPEFMITLD